MKGLDNLLNKMTKICKSPHLHIPNLHNYPIKNSILRNNHFLWLHCYMILVKNMHVVMKKDIIQDKCASLGCQTMAIIELWPGNRGNGVRHI